MMTPAQTGWTRAAGILRVILYVGVILRPLLLVVRCWYLS